MSSLASPLDRPPPPRLAVLASGSGTILEAILASGLPVARRSLVDRPCRALDVAAAHGVPGVLVERRSFDAYFDRLAYTEQVVADAGGRTTSSSWPWPAS